MGYTYRLGYAAANAGEIHVPTIYADSGVALVAQPAYNIRDVGDGAYLYVTTAMPDGQGGILKITGPNGLVSVGVISPQETENVDQKVSLISGFPSPPGTFRLSGYEQDGEGLPVDGRMVKRTVAVGPQVSSSGIVETQTKITYSNAAGFWYFNLLAGVQYSIDIPEAGVKGKLVTLAADTDFRTLLP